MKNLYLASKNKGKIEEYKKLLNGVNCKLLLQPESLEVEEDGLTFRDNAIKKASEVSKKTNNFSIADDSGICIAALDGKPGIYSSRYAENDQKRIERVLKELDGVKLRIDKNFWLLFRFSGTEPLLRLYCEAPKESYLIEVLEWGQEFINLAGK